MTLVPKVDCVPELWMEEALVCAARVGMPYICSGRPSLALGNIAWEPNGEFNWKPLTGFSINMLLDWLAIPN